MSSPPARSGYVDPNFPNPNGSHDATIIIYGYVPNYALCILGSVLFAIAFLVHGFQVYRYRLWSFSPLTLACLMEVLGYIFRSLSSHKDPYNIIYFVVQYFLIVTAPVFISASIYVCLTRLIRWAAVAGIDVAKNAFFRKPKLILWIFITADVVSTVLQVAGAGLIGSAESDRKSPTTANNILLSGLAFQTFAFLIFLILLALFLYFLFQAPGFRIKTRETSHRTLIPFLLVLSVASLLVFVRTVFRLVETSQGVMGYLSTHEGFFGGLEFAPMVIAVGLLAGWHPARAVPTVIGREKSNVSAV